MGPFLRLAVDARASTEACKHRRVSLCHGSPRPVNDTKCQLLFVSTGQSNSVLTAENGPVASCYVFEWIATRTTSEGFADLSLTTWVPRPEIKVAPDAQNVHGICHTGQTAKCPRG